MNMITYDDCICTVVCDEGNNERVLASYYGIGVPSAAKRRLQQRLTAHSNIPSLVITINIVYTWRGDCYWLREVIYH